MKADIAALRSAVSTLTAAVEAAEARAAAAPQDALDHIAAHGVTVPRLAFARADLPGHSYTFVWEQADALVLRYGRPGFTKDCRWAFWAKDKCYRDL